WNIVFNQFYQLKNKQLEPLKISGIDTGMGLERLAMVAQKAPTVFETDLFSPITELVPGQADTRVRRIIADHARAIAFLISDGVIPSNKDQGYVLRRLMRRIIVHEHLLGAIDFEKIFKAAEEIYGKFYPEISAGKITDEFNKEKDKFSKTLKNGLKELDRLPALDAPSAFRLYESYGLPYEIIKELGGNKAQSLTREAFEEEFKKHQEKSRAGSEKKFGGHGLLLDTGELKAADEAELAKVTRLHTATHLLHSALRKILGETVQQAGSDITAERLRFDFTFQRKLTADEIKKIEDLVNDAVGRGLKVTKEEMPYEDAIKTGALSFFKLKYPSKVNVYSVGPDKYGDPSTSSGPPFSRELCGGPHVDNTGAIGRITITKEEAVSAGVRRIRATVE
ncbi:MAG: alanine--tRNA ligase-related protein, partial [Candidatus Yanofskybacteria bacterium]|nr:alanine--tRNA ligase-related protein [Candidatus Yanofskybacteria bacterium]